MVPSSTMSKRPWVLPSTLVCLGQCFDRLCKFLYRPTNTDAPRQDGVGDRPGVGAAGDHQRLRMVVLLIDWNAKDRSAYAACDPSNRLMSSM